MANAPHLIERAAARLAASGAVPGRLSPVPAAGSASVAPQEAAPHGNAREFPPDTAAAALPPIRLALLEQAGLMADRAARSRISEELWLVQRQTLRTAFALVAGLKDVQSGEAKTAAAPANLLLVTSARPGEGKSFTALNLAAGIARQGDHPVLLIDADVKASSLTQLLGLRAAPGLLDLAADGALDPARLEHPTELERLSILPTGAASARGSDLLASRHVGQLLHGLARRHPQRLVILDGAPCLATSDPAALAPLMGQIIFVVEAERTQRRSVEDALDLIQDCPTITLLLNKMRQGAGHAFGAYAPYYTS
jgi:protein-tyrosine kinase